jgi:DNA polymerase I-like protein with 3'-5' exonuclease and polymerase domains
MSELYSRIEFELDRRIAEADRVGVGFDLPSLARKLMSCSKCSKNLEAQAIEVAA